MSAQKREMGSDRQGQRTHQRVQTSKDIHFLACKGLWDPQNSGKVCYHHLTVTPLAPFAHEEILASHPVTPSLNVARFF